MMSPRALGALLGRLNPVQRPLERLSGRRLPELARLREFTRVPDPSRVRRHHARGADRTIWKCGWSSSSSGPASWSASARRLPTAPAERHRQEVLVGGLLRTGRHGSLADDPASRGRSAPVTLHVRLRESPDDAGSGHQRSAGGRTGRGRNLTGRAARSPGPPAGAVLWPGAMTRETVLARAARWRRRRHLEPPPPAERLQSADVVRSARSAARAARRSGARAVVVTGAGEAFPPGRISARCRRRPATPSIRSGASWTCSSPSTSRSWRR